MKPTLFILVVCVIVLNPTIVMSHHGRSNFLYDVSITLEGKVVDSKWRNPHMYIEIQTANENNETETWLIEGGTPIALLRTGWQKDSINVGDNVVITGNPDRDRARKFLLLDKITLEDGESFSVFNSKRPNAGNKIPVGKLPSTTKLTVSPSQDFSGTWRPGPSNFVTGDWYRPPTNWPLTKLGEEQVAGFNRLNNPSFECLERGLPFFPVKNYDVLWARLDDRIEIIQHHYVSTRTIYLNQDKHPDELNPRELGHSIARIDDDGNLLVDTVGFPDSVKWGLAPGLESSAQKRIRERYTLNKDGIGIEFTITIEDPIYLKKPVTINGSYFKVADVPFEPYVCDLEAAGRHKPAALNTP